MSIIVSQMDPKSFRKCLLVAFGKMVLFSIFLCVCLILIDEVLSLDHISSFDIKVAFKEIDAILWGTLFISPAVSSIPVLQIYRESSKSSFEITNRILTIRRPNKTYQFPPDKFKKVVLIDEKTFMSFVDSIGQRYRRIILVRRGFSLFRSPITIGIVAEEMAAQRTREIAQALGVQTFSSGLSGISKKI